MKTIYIIKAFGGQWEDSWEVDVLATHTEDRAKELIRQYEKERDDYEDDILYYKDYPEELNEHFNDVDYGEGDFGCSEGCYRCEVEDFSMMDALTCYRYDVVDIEEEDV